jgi:hypothetical protein
MHSLPPRWSQQLHLGSGFWSPPFIKSYHVSKVRNLLGVASLTHACNPSYSGGRDQEDRSSKPARANSSWDPISKKPIRKKGLRWRPWVRVPVPDTHTHKSQKLIWLQEAHGKKREKKSVHFSSRICPSISAGEGQFCHSGWRPSAVA